MLKNVLRVMWRNHYAWPFQKPVDPVSLGIPDYFKIVKRPMDMGTIKKKLEQNVYHSAKECMEDFKLMFNNCYLYNKPTDDIVMMCQSLEKVFDQKIQGMPNEEFEVTLPQKGSKKGAARGCPKKAKLVPTMVSNVAQSQ